MPHPGKRNPALRYPGGWRKKQEQELLGEESMGTKSVLTVGERRRNEL